MDIREVIERARRAQQENPQKHPVQLEIHPEFGVNWGLNLTNHGSVYSQAEIDQLAREYGTILPATYDEYMEHFRATTFGD